MIRIILSLILLISLSCQQSNKSSDNNSQKSGTLNQAALTTTEFNIEGMTCTGCENTIKANINKLNGIKDATASYTSGTAIVTYDTTKVNADEITKAIDESGYKTVSFRKK